jgi:hypothetical protein
MLHRRKQKTFRRTRSGAHTKPDPRSVRKIKISPTCTRRNPQNMFERNKIPADCTEHNPHEYKEYAHMSLAANPISQPSLGISLIWTPTIEAEVRKL